MTSDVRVRGDRYVLAKVEGAGRTTSIPHVSALDGARGLAVAGVVLFHGGHLLGGYLGVDFFFTLSGFLITSLLLAEAGRTGGLKFGRFWARRARRLLPALAVLMAGVALYSATLAKPSELAQIRGDALATLGYVANWHEIFAHQSYFALFSAPSPLNHTWSLAIEEQFYVIWPLLFFFVAVLATRKGAVAKAVFATSLGLAAVSAALMIALYTTGNTNRVYFGTDARAAAILLGAALAAFLTMHGPAASRRGRVTLEGAGICGAAVLAIAWTRLDGQSPTLYRGGFLLCGVAATAVIAAAVHPARGPVARVLSLRPLCGLGLISYGVYLYHWPIDVVLDQERVGIGGWALFSVQTAVTLAVAIASYKIIEQPIRSGRVTRTDWLKVVPAVAAGLVVAILASTSAARTPAPGLPATDRGKIAAAALARQHAEPGAQRILLVGNSVASLLAPGFQALRTRPPLAVVDAAVLGCIFPPAVKRPPAVFAGQKVNLLPCQPSWEAPVVKAFRPTVVFWIASTEGAVGGTYQGDPVYGCSQSTFTALYERSLRQEITRLGAFGAKVVITTSPYTVRLRVHHDPVEDDCENRMRRTAAAATGARLADLFDYVCPRKKCRVKQNGVTLRPDGVHYDGPGGVLIAKWLLGAADAVSPGKKQG